ncbi:MAG: hypothetical protein ACWGQW_17215 [bacterium]
MRYWLSIDFDYFVREESIWDWGHREAPLFRDFLWQPRVQGFLHNGVDLRKEMDPQAFAKPTPDQFWKALEERGLNISRATRLIVADSHTWGAVVFGAWWPGKVPKNHRTLLSFDAHHDLGYSQHNARDTVESQNIDCASWLLWVMHQWKHLQARIIYPPWRGLEEWKYSEPSFKGFFYGDVRKRVNASVWDDDIPSGEVDQIYICRSGSWVPPWLDNQFIKFVRELESKTLADIEVPFIDEEHCNPMEPRDFDYDTLCKQAERTQEVMQSLADPDSAIRKEYRKLMKIKNQEEM